MFTSSPARTPPATRLGVLGTRRCGGVPQWTPIRADSANPAPLTRGFRNRPLELESNSRARFDAATRIPWRIGSEIRHSPAPTGVSGFQEPEGPPARPTIIGVLGTAGRVRWPPVYSGFQEPRGSGFREPAHTGYWEPLQSGDQELRLTVYSEPPFVVTGTDSRGFRNRQRRKALRFQYLAGLSTALNALTSFSNRISSNAAVAETQAKTAASWGLRPRRLASPLRGYAPGANAPSHPASPKRRRAHARQVILESLVPMIFELENRQRRRNRSNWLSEESLAFSAENPRNRRWAASAPKRGLQTR